MPIDRIFVDRTQKPFNDSRVEWALLIALNDEESAKHLLAEAGYPDGFKFTIEALPSEVDTFNMLIPYWKRIGVEAGLKVLSEVG